MAWAAEKLLPVDQLRKFIPADVHIPEDLREEAQANGLSGVDGNDGCPPIRMLQKHVAPLLSLTGKSDFVRREIRSLPVSAGSLLIRLLFESR